MSIEDIEIDNIERVERLLIQKHGALNKGLENHLNRFKSDLEVYEIGEVLLDRVNEVMHEVSLMDEMSKIEEAVKYLNDTFWHQMEEGSYER